MKRAFQTAATSLALIVFVAFCARLAFAWDQERQLPPDIRGVVPFLNETGNIAFSLARGDGFSSPFRGDSGPTAWLTPVYPLMIAGIFKLFGIQTVGSFFAAVFLNILFSSAACIPLFHIGKRIGGIGVAAGAAWLWALFPNAIIIPYEWIWDTSLSALLAAILLWATLKLADSARVRDWCGYGLLWGFSLMTDPALGALLPFLLVWASRRARGSGRIRFREPMLAAGIAVLCCVPWTIRNYAVFHRFVPLRSNFAYELFLGNNSNFDDGARDSWRVITQRDEVAHYIHIGEDAFMREKWRQATRFIRSHPRLEMKLSARRFVAVWEGFDDPVKRFRETDSVLIQFLLVVNALVTLATLAGIVFLFRTRNPAAFPIAVFPIVFPAVYYITHANLRYRHPIDPIIILLCAIAVSSLIPPSPWRRAG